MSYLGRSAKLSRKTQEKVSFLATAGQTNKAGLSYVPTFVEVTVNGILLTDVTDYTATSGSSITFTVALGLNDEVTVVSLKTFALANHYNRAEADAAFEPIDSAYTKAEGDARYEPIDSAYTKAEADANLAAMVDSAPAALNTLNELAAALGDDVNFSTTVNNSIATKLPKSGGTMTGDTYHGDNVRARFGTSSDLQMYHDGSNSYIVDSGTGNMIIRGTEMNLGNADGSKTYLNAISGGALYLRHNGGTKLDTTASGVNITGVATADGLTVDGISTLNNHVKVADGYSMGWGDITTRITGNSTSDIISVYTAGSERLRLDAAGNLGLGVVPKAWDSVTRDALQIGGLGALTATPAASAGGEVTLQNNAYIATSGLEKYMITDEASTYQQSSGKHFFKVAPSGSAGSNVSWTNGMTIDNSGNLLVGKSVQASSSSGCELLSNGTAQFTRDGNSGLRINRLTSDGELIRLSKAGTALGSIGINGSIPYFLRTTGGIAIGNSALVSAGSSGVLTDAASDLGGTSNRWKELYLSGGIHLGGTGSANKLDDYEEGTWRPTASAGGTAITLANASTVQGTYTKIGRTVRLDAQIQITNLNSASGTFLIGGLPFTVGNLLIPTGVEASGTVSYYSGFASAVNSLAVYASGGTSTLGMVGITSATSTGATDLNANILGGSSNFRFSISYSVA